MHCKKIGILAAEERFPLRTSGIQLRSPHLRRKDHVLDNRQEVKTPLNRIKLSPTGPRDFISTQEIFRTLNVVL